MSEQVCVCGCTKEQHDFEHEESHYPESRSVDYWAACEKHNCGRYRPVEIWPTSVGWWWCGKGELHECRELTAGELCLIVDGEWYEPRDWKGRMHFTKLLEPNPFKDQP